MCGYINEYRVPSEPLLDYLVDQRWLRFPNHRHVLSFDNGITSLGEWCDGQDPSISLAYWSFSLLLLLSWWQIHIPSTMRLCNSRIPEEYLVCYQMSQHNWVIIKTLYMYLRRCLLGWRRSILGFFTPSIREVSLVPLGNTHHKLSSNRLRS